MLGRKERRQARHERNKEKDKTHKEEAWEEGKLIEENHNDGPYSVSYTMALTTRLIQRLLEEKEKGNAYHFRMEVQRLKKRMIDLILHYNPGVPKGPDYQYINKLLEVYWDEVLPFGNDNALFGI